MASVPSPKPGRYKFTVKSAEQAVAIIRDQLGPAARVLSVRSVPAKGFSKLFSGPQLEVIAEVDAPLSVRKPGFAAVSAEKAEPILPDRMTTMPAIPFVPTAPETPPVAKKPPGASKADLAALLRKSGLTETVLSRLQSDGKWEALNLLPLHHALAETSRLLREKMGVRPARPAISRAAFLGTAGVGRTTALCKYLSMEVFRRARIGHVVSVEFDQPNALGALPVFSEALGVPLAHFPCGTQPAVPSGFVYFDLPALSPKSAADNTAMAEFLDSESIIERVLVLNAAYDRASLRNAYSAGRDLGATHLVFTHLDEVPHWGKLWDYLFDEALEPLFLSTGPSLTSECEEDVPAAIAAKTLPEAGA